MAELIEVTNGYAFLLFASRAEMALARQMMFKGLRGKDHDIFFQTPKTRTEALLRDFENRAHHCLKMGTPGPVLFGLKSFWQGVSVEGPALQLVCVAKIWFPHREDPYLVEAEERYGRKSFMLYSVPKCIEQLVQAEGRLIRTPTDYGIFAVMDPRLNTARYGSKIKNSLHTRENETMVLKDLKSRFQAIKQHWEGNNGSP